jgi:hypothetical protein
MTQTQDEQNVQTAGEQMQETTPVAEEQNVQTTVPDLSAVDVVPEAPIEQPAAPIEQEESSVQEVQAPVLNE